MIDGCWLELSYPRLFVAWPPPFLLAGLYKVVASLLCTDCTNMIRGVLCSHLHKSISASHKSLNLRNLRHGRV